MSETNWLMKSVGPQIPPIKEYKRSGQRKEQKKFSRELQSSWKSLVRMVKTINAEEFQKLPTLKRSTNSKSFMDPATRPGTQLGQGSSNLSNSSIDKSVPNQQSGPGSALKQKEMDIKQTQTRNQARGVYRTETLPYPAKTRSRFGEW